MTKIGLFGGLFDPPHWGHVWAVQQIVERKKYVDEVWIMPAYQHPWRRGFASSNHRFKMVKKAFEAHFRVDATEMERKGTSYTIDTIRLLKHRYPNHVFSWIIGSDGVKSLPKWRNYNALVQEMSFVVFPRLGFCVQEHCRTGLLLTTRI